MHVAYDNFRFPVFVQIRGKHGIGEGFPSFDLEPGSEIPVTQVEIDEQSLLLVTGGDIQTSIAIEIGDCDGASGGVGRTKRPLAGEISFSIVEVNHALAFIAASHDQVLGSVPIHVPGQYG